MIIDDFGANTCPGVDVAVGEFLSVNMRFRLWNLRTKQAIIEKII